MSPTVCSKHNSEEPRQNIVKTNKYEKSSWYENFEYLLGCDAHLVVEERLLNSSGSLDDGYHPDKVDGQTATGA